VSEVVLERHHRGKRKGIYPRKSFVAMLTFGVLSSCSVADRFAEHSIEYNIQAETIKNQNLLNNIIRSAYRKPLQFTDLSTITGQLSVSGIAGFAVPFGGPRAGFIFSPSVSASDTPNFTVSVLNTQEFYRGILAPITLQIIAYYLNEGFPPHVLLTLLISEIKEDDQSLYNNTGINKDGQPNYPLFVSTLEGLIDENGLTVQPYEKITILGPPLGAEDVKKMDIAKLDTQQITVAKHNISDEGDELSAAQKAKFKQDGVYYQLEKTEVSYRFCFHPSASGETDTCVEKKKEAAGAPSLSNRQKGGVYALNLGGRKIGLNVRSVEGIIYYLGEWARQEFFAMGENPTASPTIFSRYSHCGKEKRDILFRVERGTGQELSISSSYEGNDYYVRVDPNGCDRSSQVMELVLELLALNNSAKDLPAPSVIPVLTR
jgi:hypothetical protein